MKKIFLKRNLRSRLHISFSSKGDSCSQRVAVFRLKNFSELSKKTKLPIYALGGLSKEDLSAAEKNGAYGIAGISGF